MNHKRTRIIIGITAFVLALHACVLLFLFIFYHSSPGSMREFNITNSVDASETIFFDQPSQSENEESSFPPPNDEQWAQLNPRSGTLGSSMEMPNEEFGIESNGTETQGIQDTKSENTDAQENDEAGGMVEDSTMQDEVIDLYPSAPTTFIHTANEFSANAQKSLSEKKLSSKKHEQNAKKIAAQKTIAGITRGYLENLKNEGDNLIKTLGGDPNKKPTAEQLKYERYLAKIQWCLQNAHSINMEKCQSQQPVEATMKLYFTLNRMGKMNDFRIIQSSGNAFADQYITSLFEFASSSFPPLPDYIKENPYPLFYTVMVNWNATPTSYMGFTRN